MACHADLMSTADSPAMIDVTEYTDPICSWAWGTEPKLRLLRWRHGHRCDWRVVMGGLVGDATRGRTDWDPVLAAGPMSAYWKQTHGFTGQPYPRPMRRMGTSTDPAGRAVKAALRQGPDVADGVLRRLRESIFIFGVVPDTPETFAAAVGGLEGLDVDRWLADLESGDVAAAYRADWEETRRPNDHVRNLDGERPGIGSMKHSEGRDRYAFPTLVMRGPGGEHTVPGWMPYDAYVGALEAALPGSTADPRPDPTVSEALDRWEMLTEKELRTLCGDSAMQQLPERAVAHFWGTGLAIIDAETAERRSLPTVGPAAIRSLADLGLAFDAAMGVVEELADVETGDERWLMPTTCEGWDMRSLLNHMVGSARMVTHGVTGQEIGPEFYGDHLGSDPVAAYRAATDEAMATYRADPAILEQTLTLPWGDLTGAELAIMFAADHLVHAWDVARSLGVELDVDDDLVARVRVFADDYAPSHREPGMFGPEQPAPERAPALDRLAAFVGRRLDQPIIPLPS